MAKIIESILSIAAFYMILKVNEYINTFEDAVFIGLSAITVFVLNNNKKKEDG